MKKIIFTIATVYFTTNVFTQDFCTADGTLNGPTGPKTQTCHYDSEAFIDEMQKQHYWIPVSSSQTKTLKYQIHFFQKSDGTGNWFDIPETYSRFNQINDWLNGLYQNVDDHSMTIPGVADINETYLQFDLVDLHFYQNDAMWNTYNTSVLENYITLNNPERNDVFHVFITGADFYAAGYSFFPDFGDVTGAAHSIFTGKNDPTEPVDFFLAQHLAHEFGHSLDLRHMYNNEHCVITHMDFLDDVFVPNFPGVTPPSGCDVAYYTAACDLSDPNAYCTNNVMSGKGLLSYYFSPKQIGRINRVAHLKETREFIWGYSTIPHEITADETWDFSIKMYEDIVVKSGNTLTITCEVQMVPEAKIIIEPGAKLIVDGGIITKAKHSKQYWQGIEVWGNSDENQINQANQGVLITRNNATIEYAINAIQTIKKENGVLFWDKTGGIISCSNTTFKNNRRSCEYMYYHAEHPSNPSIELLNKGRFTNCTFLWDDDYTYPSTPFGITMFHVNGVQVSGCDFEDTRAGIPLADRANGVFTIDAGYKVIGRYTGGGQFYPPTFPQHDTYNETDYDISHFTNLRYGVHAMNSASFYPITVDHTFFLNDSYGIVLDAVDNAVVTRNRFHFNEDAPDFMTSMFELSFRESSGFLVEGNEFLKSGTGYGAGGTLVLNSGAQANQIYRNTYDGVNVGNWGRGFNSNDLSAAQFASGLQWKCNDNLNGYIDMLNDPISYSPALNGEGVRLLQGSIDEPTGNTVSPNIGSGLPTSDLHFYQGDQDLLGYYYGVGANEEPTETQGPIATTGLQEAKNCPSSFVNKIVIARSKMITDAQKPVLQSRVLEIDQELAIKRADLDTLLANGDATYLHDLVNNLSNQNKNQVKATLFSESPYLSQSLLEELGQKQPSLFPHSWYRDLINANMEVARNNDFMNTLLIKPHPMPSGMYNQISYERYTTFTARGEKELELLGLSDEREVLMNLFISDAMSGEEEIDWDEVKQYIIHRDNIECKRQVADYHLSREEVASCSSILDLIELQLSSIKMERVKEELENFVFLKRYLISITNNTGIIGELQPNDIAQFEYMAVNFKGKAARQARNILCFHANLCDDIDLEIPEAVQHGNKSMPARTDNSSSGIERLSIVPNPHAGNFKLAVADGCKILQVVVHDVKGTEVQFEQLYLLDNNATIQLRNQEQGIYIVTVRCEDGTNYTGRSLLTTN